MIIPCIDLMEGKVVQLIQGREKALEAESVDAMLEKFAGFPQIQAIDLDAAMNRGSNDALVAHIATKAAAEITPVAKYGILLEPTLMSPLFL